MAAKTKKSKAGETLSLEQILFNCRDYLRGNASLNDKRDLLLTLVFLRFIGEKFDDAVENIKENLAFQGLPLLIVFACRFSWSTHCPSSNPASVPSKLL